MFGRAIGCGSLAGMILGFVLGALAWPAGGEVFGVIVGLFVGPIFGMFGAFVLAGASGFLLARRPRWAAGVSGTASVIAALLFATLLKAESITGLWALLIGSGTVGAACGPRVFWGRSHLKQLTVSRPSRRAAS